MGVGMKMLKVKRENWRIWKMKRKKEKESLRI
jgi:hypothetical protein